MDSNVITAAAAALGSFLGTAASVVTTWITQRKQTALARMEENLRTRESLYGEFIAEASHLTLEAMSHSLEKPETFVKLYGLLGRIRLLATRPVLAAAEACCRQIVDLFARPNMTIEQIRVAIERERLDPLREFSAVCRTELLDIAARA